MQIGAQIGGLASSSHQVNVAAPKELGYLQRIEGLNSGVLEMKQRLSNLVARLEGGDDSKGHGGGIQAAAPVGLSSTLSDIEGHLRDCLELLGHMNGRF